jgi:hypothetical protein
MPHTPSLLAVMAQKSLMVSKAYVSVFPSNLVPKLQIINSYEIYISEKSLENKRKFIVTKNKRVRNWYMRLASVIMPIPIAVFLLLFPASVSRVLAEKGRENAREKSSSICLVSESVKGLGTTVEAKYLPLRNGTTSVPGV